MKLRVFIEKYFDYNDVILSPLCVLTYLLLTETILIILIKLDFHIYNTKNVLLMCIYLTQI